MRARRQASVRRAQDPAPRAASPSCAHLDGREKVVHRRGWRPLECGARAGCQRFFEYFPPVRAWSSISAARAMSDEWLPGRVSAARSKPALAEGDDARLLRACAPLSRDARARRASAIGAPVAFRASAIGPCVVDDLLARRVRRVSRIASRRAPRTANGGRRAFRDDQDRREPRRGPEARA